MPNTVEIGPQVTPILDFGAQYRSLRGEVLAAVPDSLSQRLPTCVTRQTTGAALPIRMGATR